MSIGKLVRHWDSQSDICIYDDNHKANGGDDKRLCLAHGTEDVREVRDVYGSPAIRRMVRGQGSPNRIKVEPKQGNRGYAVKRQVHVKFYENVLAQEKLVQLGHARLAKKWCLSLCRGSSSKVEHFLSWLSSEVRLTIQDRRTILPYIANTVDSHHRNKYFVVKFQLLCVEDKNRDKARNDPYRG